MQFNSISNASTWYANSGYSDWEWFAEFDEGELIEFAYRNADDFDSEETLVAAFLAKHGEYPEDYGLPASTAVIIDGEWHYYDGNATYDEMVCGLRAAQL